TAEPAEYAEKSRERNRSLDWLSHALQLARDDLRIKNAHFAGVNACSTQPTFRALFLHRPGHQELLMYLVVLQVLGGERVVLATVLGKLCGVVLAEHSHQLDHRAGGAFDHGATVRRAECWSEHGAALEGDVAHAIAQALAHDFFVTPQGRRNCARRWRRHVTRRQLDCAPDELLRRPGRERD